MAALEADTDDIMNKYPDSCDFSIAMADLFINADDENRMPTQEEVVLAVQAYKSSVGEEFTHPLLNDPARPLRKRKAPTQYSDDEDGFGEEDRQDFQETGKRTQMGGGINDDEDSDYEPTQRTRMSERSNEDGDSDLEPTQMTQMSHHSEDLNVQDNEDLNELEPKPKAQKFEYDSDNIDIYQDHISHIDPVFPSEDQCAKCLKSGFRCYEYAQPTTKRACRRCVRLRVGCSTSWRRTKGRRFKKARVVSLSKVQVTSRKPRNAAKKKRSSGNSTAGKTASRANLPSNIPQMDNLCARLIAVENSQKTFKSQISTLQSSIKGFEVDLETSNAYIETNISSMHTEIKEQLGTIHNIEYRIDKRLDSHHEQLAAVRDQLDVHEARIENHSQQLVGVREELRVMAAATSDMARSTRDVMANLEKTMTTTFKEVFTNTFGNNTLESRVRRVIHDIASTSPLTTSSNNTGSSAATSIAPASLILSSSPIAPQDVQTAQVIWSVIKERNDFFEEVIDVEQLEDQDVTPGVDGRGKVGVEKEKDQEAVRANTNKKQDEVTPYTQDGADASTHTQESADASTHTQESADASTHTQESADASTHTQDAVDHTSTEVKNTENRTDVELGPVKGFTDMASDVTAIKAAGGHEDQFMLKEPSGDAVKVTEHRLVAGVVAAVEGNVTDTALDKDFGADGDNDTVVNGGTAPDKERQEVGTEQGTGSEMVGGTTHDAERQDVEPERGTGSDKVGGTGNDQEHQDIDTERGMGSLDIGTERGTCPEVVLDNTNKVEGGVKGLPTGSETVADEASNLQGGVNHLDPVVEEDEDEEDGDHDSTAHPSREQTPVSNLTSLKHTNLLPEYMDIWSPGASTQMDSPRSPAVPSPTPTQLDHTETLEPDKPKRSRSRARSTGPTRQMPIRAGRGAGKLM
ncbi:hypothetical protein JR316_0013180 [Psilocybe cubensis]|nr:hypothetical protein JR316_0013180 [Psilocybe cubensis]KAH9474715.1 hypothetical protein JR316_0013180 [Psilocybe cubensis]